LRVNNKIKKKEIKRKKNKNSLLINEISLCFLSLKKYRKKLKKNETVAIKIKNEKETENIYLC